MSERDVEWTETPHALARSSEATGIVKEADHAVILRYEGLQAESPTV